MVDKSFMTEGEEGYRLAKIRIREERIPAMGDKFSSRVGQKGTIGLILEEENMPFTADGLRPDIIVNPHAMPSRMTIGQLIECLMGKACVLYGGFGDCTAWVNKGPKDKQFGKMLTRQGFHSSGTEILYNGMTGEQLEANIYIGPTYYMRLKHMVKDKINYRTRGPRTALTRQTIGGRAKDGGLRIGEMDRDVIIGHGMSEFLNESFLTRGDEFYVAICNKTGTIAIYNESKDIFLSPMADGPIKFVTNKDESLNIINISRFGRSFSIVRVPYAFKLLYQELQAMNIQMRIITDANVDQLTSLKKGDDIRKLTGWDTIKQVTEETRKLLGKMQPTKRPARPPRPARTPPKPKKEPETVKTPTLREIAIPAGKSAGDILLVDIDDNTQVEIEIPEGVGEGDILQFEVPTPKNVFYNPKDDQSLENESLTGPNPFAPPGVEMITTTASKSSEEDDDADSPQYEASSPVESTDSAEYMFSSQEEEEESVPDSNLLTTIEGDNVDVGEDKGETRKIN